jgi:hypothetical protein
LTRAAVLVVAGVAFIVAAATFAEAEVFRVGNVFVIDNGRVSPAKLPRHKQAPAAAIIDAEIGTTDGSHPPAFREANAYFDKNIHLNAVGLPVCKLGQLQTRSTAAAKKACPDAIVGSGEAEVEVAFPEQKPFTAKGPLVAFNGGVHGGTTFLFVHAYVAVPAPTAVVTTVKITRIHRGPFGLHVIARIPEITGGAGSGVKVKLTIKRTFSYQGDKQNYLTASCPIGFFHAEGIARFAGGLKVSLSHALPCTPIG